MRVTYKLRQHEKLISNPKKLFSEFGECSRKIRQRIEELLAADNLSLMPPHARTHPLSGNYQGMFGIKITHNERMMIQPIGSFDLKDIKTIVEIEIVSLLIDYHK
jgi:hypothetical protein